LSDPSQFQYNIIKPTTCSIFAESLVDIQSRNSGESNANVTTTTTTHPHPANAQQDLRGYWTKVHEIFNRGRAIFGGVIAIITVAILPTIVECQWSE